MAALTWLLCLCLKVSPPTLPYYWVIWMARSEFFNWFLVPSYVGAPNFLLDFLLLLVLPAWPTRPLAFSWRTLWTSAGSWTYSSVALPGMRSCSMRTIICSYIYIYYIYSCFYSSLYYGCNYVSIFCFLNYCKIFNCKYINNRNSHMYRKQY